MGFVVNGTDGHVLDPTVVSLTDLHENIIEEVKPNRNGSSSALNFFVEMEEGIFFAFVCKTYFFYLLMFSFL